jgi:DNA helicase-2/ATP-dependent DNA helicase PcrA
MSVHAAKGLEWDRVAMPQLVSKNFPSEPRDLAGWLAGGILPHSYRLDKDSIPNLDWQGITTQRDFKQRLERYEIALRKHHQMQERRLMYVGITRAAEQLLLTASHYQEKRKDSVEISTFLEELIPNHLAATKIADKPLEKPVRPKQITYWPADPLGTKRGQWEKAADMAAQAEPAELSKDIALLIKERQLRRQPALPTLPVRLSASSVVRLLTSPVEFAQQLARPTPSTYSSQAQLGTLFHANLEESFKSGSELDFSGWSEEEKKLGVSFEQSRFGKLKPSMVEESIEFAFAGFVIVCKLDAVYKENDSFHVVDWKSGKLPTDSELPGKAIQLALYRIALSKFLSVPLERIRASFFYAESAREIEPQLPTELELRNQLVELRKAHPNQQD